MTVVLTCPHCGFSKQIPKHEIPMGAKWLTCSGCGGRFDFFLSNDKAISSDREMRSRPWLTESRRGAGGEAGRTGSPWENAPAGGFWKGMVQTCKEVIFRPSSFFTTLTFKGGMQEPLAFGLLLGSIGRMVGFFWQFLIWYDWIPFFQRADFARVPYGFLFLSLLIAIPIFLTAGILLYSGILHMLLRTVGGGKNGYEATLRVICYTQAAEIWGFIPVVGGWIGEIWQFVSQVIGLREIHETSYLRIFIAFLIPPALVFIIALALLIPLWKTLTDL